MTITVHHALHSNEYAECPSLAKLPGWAIEILLILQVNESQMAKIFGVNASLSSIAVKSIIHAHNDRQGLIS